MFTKDEMELLLYVYDIGYDHIAAGSEDEEELQEMERLRERILEENEGV